MLSVMPFTIKDEIFQCVTVSCLLHSTAPIYRCRPSSRLLTRLLCAFPDATKSRDSHLPASGLILVSLSAAGPVNLALRAPCEHPRRSTNETRKLEKKVPSLHRPSAVPPPLRLLAAKVLQACSNFSSLSSIVRNFHHRRAPPEVNFSSALLKESFLHHAGQVYLLTRPFQLSPHDSTSQATECTCPETV
jgi:hypothetical protein